VNDVINKATPRITWDPADITYPTALGDAQLNATADYLSVAVPGTFDYTPDNCELLPIGNDQTLSVDFYPDDQRNYNNVLEFSVTINVLAPTVSKEKVGGLWICTQSDASGYPVAMYVCPTEDCNCMTDPTNNPNRCVDSSVVDVTFAPTELKWAGPGSGTVDFVTSQTVDSQTYTIVYRCVEGVDLCLSCGDPRKSWTCDPHTRGSLFIPAFSRSGREKIEDVWVCAGSPDQSGCFTTVYSCANATDQNPCPCDPNNPNDQNLISWLPSTVLSVEFAEGELKWTGPSGSDNVGCETVYFITLDCIYKCSSDTGQCFSYCP